MYDCIAISAKAPSVAYQIWKDTRKPSTKERGIRATIVIIQHPNLDSWRSTQMAFIKELNFLAINAIMLQRWHTILESIKTYVIQSKTKMCPSFWSCCVKWGQFKSPHDQHAQHTIEQLFEAVHEKSAWGHLEHSCDQCYYASTTHSGLKKTLRI